MRRPVSPDVGYDIASAPAVELFFELGDLIGLFEKLLGAVSRVDKPGERVVFADVLLDRVAEAARSSRGRPVGFTLLPAPRSSLPFGGALCALMGPAARTAEALQVYHVQSRFVVGNGFCGR